MNRRLGDKKESIRSSHDLEDEIMKSTNQNCKKKNKF